jgi:CheY-like chemotaxis protein
MFKGQHREALIVEDDPDARRMVATCLRRMGFSIHEVKSNAEAVKWLEGLTPDVVLLDLRLPDGNGLRVCESIRASERLRDVPVLVISALAAPSDLEKAEAVGADEYLVKPFRTAALTASVRDLVARSEFSPS